MIDRPGANSHGPAWPSVCQSKSDARADTLNRMPKATIPDHDPGPDAAADRGEANAEAPRHPLRLGDGTVRIGTASWTDPTMTAPGVFYPPDASTAEDRLVYYANQFPIVEVDSTYYALPARRT